MLERLCYKTEFEVEGWRKIPPLMEILENNLDPAAVSKLKVQIIEEYVIAENRLMSQFNWQKFQNYWQDRDFDSAFNHGFMAKIGDSWIYNHYKDDKTKANKIVLYVTQPLTINEIVNFESPNALTSVGSHCMVVKGIKKRKFENQTDTQNHFEEFFEIENFDGGRNRFISVQNPFFEEVQAIVEQIFLDLYAVEYKQERKKRLDLYGKILEKKLNSFENHRDHIFIRAMVPGFERKMIPCFQLRFNMEDTVMD